MINIINWTVSIASLCTSKTKMLDILYYHFSSKFLFLLFYTERCFCNLFGVSVICFIIMKNQVIECFCNLFHNKVKKIRLLNVHITKCSNILLNLKDQDQTLGFDYVSLQLLNRI